jgi:hypothetical protein
MLAEILDLVKSSLDSGWGEGVEKETFTLQERYDNAPLRHLDDKEIKLKSNTQAIIIKELGITVVLNAAGTFLINQSLATITNDFNVIFPLMGLLGINTLSSLTILGDEKAKKFFFPIAGCRVLISASINGQKLMQINKEFESSKQVYQKLNTEIQNFENGYKPESKASFDFGIIGIVIAVIIVFKMIKK